MIFWGAAAIFDELALGKVMPLNGLMARQFILSGVLLLGALGGEGPRPQERGPGPLKAEGAASSLKGKESFCRESAHVDGPQTECF